MWIKCTSHTRTKDTKSQLYTCACWKWETQRIDSRKKLEINYETKKNFLTPARFLRGCHAKKRVLNRFFGIRDFPHLMLGIRDFKAKSERDLGLEVCAGITGLHEVLGRDYGSEKPYWGPSENESLLSPGLHYRSPVASRFGKRHLNSHLSYPMLPNNPAIQKHRVSSHRCYTAEFSSICCGILTPVWPFTAPIPYWESHLHC